MPELIDTHCHLDFIGEPHQQKLLWQQCRAQGFRAMLVPGVSPAQWSRVIALAGDGVKIALGVHPCYLDGDDVPATADAVVEQLQQTLAPLLAREDKGGVVAIGECGLDGMIDTPMQKQIEFFDAQLALAATLNLPVIVHARRCHNEMLRSLKRVRLARGGIIHAFSGSLEIAREYTSLGFYLGVGGTITYERANKTRTAIAQMPLETLVLETDAPDMPLAGFQGEPNSPLQLPRVAQVLAQLRDKVLPDQELQDDTLETVCTQTTANACRLFGITAQELAA